MTDLRGLHAMVWDFRRARGGADITPHDDPDNLRRAFCSCGVAMYWQVQKQPEWVREALACCAYWLLTAVGPEFDAWPDADGMAAELDMLCCDVATAMSEFYLDPNEVRRNIAYIVLDITLYPGLDLAAELAARLASENAERGER